MLFLVELDSTVLAGEEPDLSTTLGLDDTGISFVASSSGKRGRQSGLLDLDVTLPSEMPGPLMASSPVRLRAAMSVTSGIAVVAASAEANFWDGLPDVVAGGDAPAGETSVAAPSEDVQPTSTTAEVQLENGKS